ncbi:hypothetical protein BH23GEM6_BH23GEM6_13340 [soil metagenome]
MNKRFAEDFPNSSKSQSRRWPDRSTAVIIVGSTNPEKLAAVREVVGTLFERSSVSGIQVTSGVADQPLSNEETMKGAEGRARAAMEARPSAYAVGIESGVAPMRARLYGFTRVARWSHWIPYRGRGDASGRDSSGTSLRLFPLPSSYGHLSRRLIRHPAPHGTCAAA